MFLILVVLLSSYELQATSKKPDKQVKSIIKSNIIKNEFIILIKDNYEYNSDEELIAKIKQDYSNKCNEADVEKIMPNLFSIKFKCEQEIKLEELKILNLSYIEEIEPNKKVSKF